MSLNHYPGCMSVSYAFSTPRYLIFPAFNFSSASLMPYSVMGKVSMIGRILCRPAKCSISLTCTMVDAQRARTVISLRIKEVLLILKSSFEIVVGKM